MTPFASLKMAIKEITDEKGYAYTVSETARGLAQAGGERTDQAEGRPVSADGLREALRASPFGSREGDAGSGVLRTYRLAQRVRDGNIMSKIFKHGMARNVATV